MFRTSQNMQIHRKLDDENFRESSTFFIYTIWKKVIRRVGKNVKSTLSTINRKFCNRCYGKEFFHFKEILQFQRKVPFLYQSDFHRVNLHQDKATSHTSKSTTGYFEKNEDSYRYSMYTFSKYSCKVS